jgi:hypothetical protein
MEKFIIELYCLKIKLVSCSELKQRKYYVLKLKEWSSGINKWYTGLNEKTQLKVFDKINHLISDVSNFIDQLSKTIDECHSTPVLKTVEKPIEQLTLKSAAAATGSDQMCNCTKKIFTQSIKYKQKNTVWTDLDAVKIWKISPESTGINLLQVSKQDCNEKYFNSLIANSSVTLSFNMKISCCLSYTILFAENQTRLKVNNVMGKFFEKAPFIGTPENIKGDYLVYKQEITENGFRVLNMDINPKEFKNFIFEYSKSFLESNTVREKSKPTSFS